MRRFALALCAVFLLCAPVQALTGGGEAALSGVISQIAELDKEIIVLEQDEELTASMLSPVGPYLSDDETPYLLPMEWNVIAEELIQPGLHLVTGTPLLTEGMTLAEGFDPTFTWPVFRIGGAVLEMASVTSNGIANVLMAQNADPLQALAPGTKAINSRTVEGWGLQTANRTDFYWEWDLSAVDPTVLGKYTVTAELYHPDWVDYPQECKTIWQTVYVMPEDRIELYAALRTSSSGALEFSWVYDSSNVTEPILERKDETGQWVRCEESWYRFQSADISAHDYLYLYLLNLPTQVPLTLRLRYQDVVNGESAERTTEPITLTVPDNIAELIAAAGERVVVNIISGNRDGGDSGGDDLPDYEQPAPEPDWGFPVWKPERNTADDMVEPVTEIVTDTYTALSGLRLEQLVELGPTVLFEKQGISVEIPSELLEDLELNANALLEVTIEHQQQHGVLIHVSADGTAMQYLGETKVRMPWNAVDGTDLQLLDADGYAIGSAVYEETGTAFFEIDKPGTYRIQALPTPAAPAEQQPAASTLISNVPEIPNSTEEPPVQEPVMVQLPIENVPKDDTEEQEPPVSDSAEPEQQPAAEPERDSFPVWWLLALIPVLGLAALLLKRWQHG